MEGERVNPLATINGISLQDLSAEQQQRSKLRLQELAIEAKVVQIINSGQWHSLHPNSGQSVSVLDNHICVGYHDDPASGYRIWKWHGLILVFDEEECGYSPEYLYGQYFQPLEKAKAMLHERAGATNGAGVPALEDKPKQEPVAHMRVSNRS